ncbi:MAG: ABC transporter ATP-binding protein [Candidatus Tectimicrobiota bacterium]|nr:MAG: ABC transporter ATP-binding protein [Candidatus Tectomicrobia bacterium]
MATLLAVRDLTTYFYTPEGVVKAVDGVSYDVEEGEIVALVGESGCGKSVSALSIMGLIPTPPGRIVRGEILFQGQNLLALDREQMRQIRGKEIAMIFQEPMTSLNPVLTIGRQLTETLEVHRQVSKEEATRRAIEVLRDVGIPDAERRLGQYPHQFSGGMRQRVMIAMALICQPKLILADEPTTALDVTIQAQILELLKELSQRFGVAIVLITHNLGVVARYADRVNVMYAGKVVERGPAWDIYYHPRHPYTLGLLRSVPRLDQPKKDKLDPIEGQPPDLVNLPPGCSFVPRCRFAVAPCHQEVPPLVPVGDGHLAACWVADKLAEEAKEKA